MDKSGNSLFREKSLQKISSPEELDDYVRVTNPGVWMVLGAVVFLLAGFIVWGFLGKISTGIDAVCISNDGISCCYVSEENAAAIQPGMKIVLSNGNEATVVNMDDQAVEAKDAVTEYAMHVAGFDDGEWIHALEISETFPEGVYAAQVITETIKPIEFIFS